MPQLKRSTNGSDKERSDKEKFMDTISFLPQKYAEKVENIFNSYFSLVMPKVYKITEDNSVPTFPNKVSTLSSQELGDYHSNLAAWLSYTSDKLKYLKVAHLVVSNEPTKIKNAYIATNPPKRNERTKEMIDAEAKTSVDYEAVEVYAIKLDGISLMLEQEYLKYEKSVSSLSREIARREVTAGF